MILFISKKADEVYTLSVFYIQQLGLRNTYGIIELSTGVTSTISLVVQVVTLLDTMFQSRSREEDRPNWFIFLVFFKGMLRHTFIFLSLVNNKKAIDNDN